MSTNIEWTDETWNPVTGCTKVSPGCDHCYAETFAERFRGVPGHHFERGFDLVLRPERLDIPLRWRKPRKVFVNSMSDLFHDDVPDEYIARVFAVMAWSYRHTFQILTKRHARMRSLLSSDRFRDLCDREWCSVQDWTDARLVDPEYVDTCPVVPKNWPLPNVWLGVSVENQQWADIRIPALLDTPAAVRFLSCEPLLGPIDLILCSLKRQTAIDWVIAGGESGRGARPMHPDWARSLRDQCTNAGVPFLFKQWGEYTLGASVGPGERRAIVDPDGRSHEVDRDRRVRSFEIFGAALMRRVGKKAAGRELDGRTWDQYPATAPQPEGAHA